ncbi:MAG: NADH-quinone oxidoreductase subunit J [Chloroflexaceae bacterium]|nr:NADH-quinone oxidoreductase subunit J [Chloroflexaceae bacterium]
MEFVMFFATAAIALIGALAMVLSPNAVHSALFLLLNFAAISVLFLLLRSPFLFAIQLTVYAGAIMVLFLFVVMLLGAERADATQDRLAWQRPLALGLALVLLIEAVFISVTTIPQTPAVASPEAEAFAAPANLGSVLLTTYVLPLQITGIILLVAIVGVVVLNQRARLRHSLELEQK